jgi:hypothetical protein
VSLLVPPPRSYRSDMTRRLAAAALALALFACSPNNSCPTATCQSGVSFILKDVVGSLATGGKIALKLCVDGTCKDVTVARTDASTRQFVEVGGLGGQGSHTVTVTATDGKAVKGEYKGALATAVDQPSGAACPAKCPIATVKVGDDGTITPGVPATAGSSTTVAGAAVPTTTAGG